jgi:hypothetical protein
MTLVSFIIFYLKITTAQSKDSVTTALGKIGITIF